MAARMWEQYRKTLVITQLFIWAACASIYYFGGGQGSIVPVLVIFVIMQLGAFAGAAFGARMKAKMERARDALPLQRRK
jgi:uncharacterized membrane protein YfcA